MGIDLRHHLCFFPILMVILFCFLPASLAAPPNTTGVADGVQLAEYDLTRLEAANSPRSGGAWHIGSAGDYAGRLTFDDGQAATNDAAVSAPGGELRKPAATYTRQPNFRNNSNFDVYITGAGKNFGSPDQSFSGGARAFPLGDMPGDDGYRLLELRWRVPGLSNDKHKLFLTEFYDYGSGIEDAYASGTGVGNRRTLREAGIGLVWTNNNDFAARWDYARKIGSDQSTADTSANGYHRLQIVYYF